MNDQGRESSRFNAPQVQLSRSRFWILLLVGVVVSLGLLWIGSSFAGPFAAILLALGTGILVTSLFNVSQLLITSSSTEQALAYQVAAQVTTALDTAREEQRRLSVTYLPTHTFPPSSVPLSTFNEVFTQDLNRTTELLFRGISARHTAVRLRTRESADIDVTLVLPDLQIPESLSDRIDYIRRYESSGETEDELKDRVTEEVKTGLVGLFLVRNEVRSLTVVLTPCPPLDRYEVLNNSLWVTLFSDVSARSFPYASAARFDNDSLLYRMQRREVVQIRSSPSYRRFQFDRRMTDRNFFRAYEEITGEQLTMTGMQDYTQEFESFAQAFRRNAELGNEGR